MFLYKDILNSKDYKDKKHYPKDDIGFLPNQNIVTLKKVDDFIITFDGLKWYK